MANRKHSLRNQIIDLQINLELFRSPLHISEYFHFAEWEYPPTFLADNKKTAGQGEI